jgi:hypothetical protein
MHFLKSKHWSIQHKNWSIREYWNLRYGITGIAILFLREGIGWNYWVCCGLIYGALPKRKIL